MTAKEIIKVIRAQNWYKQAARPPIHIEKRDGIPLRTSFRVRLQSFLPARGLAIGARANSFFFSFSLSFRCDFSASLSLPIGLDEIELPEQRGICEEDVYGRLLGIMASAPSLLLGFKRGRLGAKPVPTCKAFARFSPMIFFSWTRLVGLGLLGLRRFGYTHYGLFLKIKLNYIL